MHFQKIRGLDRPKKPASAFLRFLGEERVKSPQGTSTYREWQLKTAAKWNALTDGQKEKYISAFKSESESYKQHLAKWELKMVKQGHVDVVRNEALIDPVPKARKSKSSEQEFWCPQSSVTSSSSFNSSSEISRLSSNSTPAAEPVKSKIVNNEHKPEATQVKDTGDQKKASKPIVATSPSPENQEQKREGVLKKFKTFFKF